MAHILSNILDVDVQVCEDHEVKVNECTNEPNRNTDYLWKEGILAVNQTRYTEAPSVIPVNILYYIFMFNLWGAGLATCVFGIITNILNIITFVKQNLRDAVNISLLGLALSDLGSLLTLLFVNISFLPEFQDLDLTFVWLDFMYMWAWVHVILTRISAWITAYVTFERCLCITYPLKVKQVITPGRTKIYIAALCALAIASTIPIFYSTKATIVFDPVRNKTLHGIIFSTNRNEIETVSFVANNVVPTLAFVSVIICTIILVQKLKSKAKWRLQAIATGKADTMTVRDIKVVQMVVFVSAAFIICYSPGAVVFIWAIIDPEMRIDGKHVDLLCANFSVLFHLESINASVNIFIYLSMSSKYKKTFLQTFCWKQGHP